jgi:hypothetical protein
MRVTLSQGLALGSELTTHNRINLMSTLPTFPFLYIEHYTVFHLVEQAASFGIRENDFNPRILSP